MTIFQIIALVNVLVMLFIYVFAHRRTRELEREVKEKRTVKGSAKFQRWIRWNRIQKMAGVFCVGDFGVLIYSIIYIA